MKSIPTLVASSTVGVAATGLVFGRPQVSTPARPPSNKRKATEYDREHRMPFSPPDRPVTSSTMETPNREEESSSSPNTNSSPYEPSALSNENSPNGTVPNRIGHLNTTPRRATEIPAVREQSVEGRKDSISSRGSWIRRLSTVQTSQNDSPRSSLVGPDSPSLTFSHGSAAAILKSNGSPIQLPPNKLVKRTTSGRIGNGDVLVRSGSRSQVPTLRRPATSHQRSVTLQQFRSSREASLDTTPRQQSSSPAVENSSKLPSRISLSECRHTHWRPYFESRVTRLTKERPSGSWIEGSPNSYASSRRVLLPDASYPAPTLLKPATILNSNTKAMLTWKDAFTSIGSELDTPIRFNKISPTHEAESESHKRIRRSLSINFTSPTRWMSRSGSLRGPKRNGNDGNMGQRNVSAPMPTTPGRATMSSHASSSGRRRDITDPSIYQNQSAETHEGPLSQNPFIAASPTALSRSSSPPLPPLSRLSSFNMDLSRMGLLSSSTSGYQLNNSSPDMSASTPASPSLISPRERLLTKQATPVIIHQYKSPRQSEVMGSDRASTLVGSDYDNRGFASGDEDEMDFQSDTVFDSFRTGATGSLRSRNPPLEMMFDESPPSAGSKPKSPKALDINATTMFRESNERIVEEDEGMITPIRGKRLDKDRFNTLTRTTLASSADETMQSFPPSFSLATKDFARLAIEDDDEDEDWTKDDDSAVMGNSLSPASRPSDSVNSRRGSPAVRNALVNVMKESSSVNTGSFDDRPRSVFDWSEPLNSEKSDIMGNSPRPKTVHGKQTGDVRGGRSVGRKGPSALHIRSQSVPVVPDVAGHREHTSLAPKFGTWGLGAKGVSEDWNDDFDFMETDEPEDGTDNMTNSAMLIPPAIQASQASVVGHVGQIREICLLVEDLKRLRGQAREKGILDGAAADLWREAEGIIALAIPDDEDETLSPPKSPLFESFTHEAVGERLRDGAFSADIHGGDETTSEDENDPDRHSSSRRAGNSTRRRSVFSPDDDIFGAGGIAASRHLGEEQDQLKSASRKLGAKDSTDVARSVMKHIHQHRAASDPLRAGDPANKSPQMPFDTTSLRDLVSRANHLRTTLAEIIRKADGAISPHRSPVLARDSSPAFTRVFTDPLASPPKHLTRTQSNSSILSNSIDASPNRGLAQRMHMMTVV